MKSMWESMQTLSSNVHFLKRRIRRSALQSVWSKITLITGGVGGYSGAGADPPTCKNVKLVKMF